MSNSNTFCSTSNLLLISYIFSMISSPKYEDASEDLNGSKQAYFCFDLQSVYMLFDGFSNSAFQRFTTLRITVIISNSIISITMNKMLCLLIVAHIIHICLYLLYLQHHHEKVVMFAFSFFAKVCSCSHEICRLSTKVTFFW